VALKRLRAGEAATEEARRRLVTPPGSMRALRVVHARATPGCGFHAFVDLRTVDANTLASTARCGSPSTATSRPVGQGAAEHRAGSAAISATW